MKRVMVGAITMALVLCGVAAAAQQNGNSAGAKLQTDLRRAVMNGKLTDAQKGTLQQAGETMREAAQAKQSGGSVDRDAVKKAMADIKQIADSGAFQPEDAQAVKADLAEMQDAFEKGKRARRPLADLLHRQGQGLLSNLLSSKLPILNVMAGTR
jgi:hypothetical protein